MLARKLGVVGALSALLIAMPSHSQTGRSPADEFQTSFAGRWTGEANQNNGSSYTIQLNVTATAVDADYPELKCSGKLARIAVSSYYVIFHETITHGRFGDGGDCADSIVVIAPAGSNLAIGKFLAHGGEAFVTWALLTRQK